MFQEIKSEMEENKVVGDESAGISRRFSKSTATSRSKGKPPQKDW
jgi:hypothetical protein